MKNNGQGTTRQKEGISINVSGDVIGTLHI